MSVVALVVAVPFAGTSLAGASAPTCQPWNGIEPASGLLAGVAMLPDCEVWAVGGVQQTVALHLFGQAWTKVPSPDPGGSARTTSLSSVAATSARDAWAVGDYSDGKAFRTLIVHWDGVAWTRVRSPNPGRRFDGLFAVAANSARSAWAVGNYSDGKARQTLILHWNGRSWTRQPSPNRSPDGPPHIDQLQGVAATSARNAWAVGYYEIAGGGFYTLVLHWDGTRWHWVPSPDPAGDNDFLIGVAADSAGSAWAVGGYDLGAGELGAGEQSFILHWNGIAWQD